MDTPQIIAPNPASTSHSGSPAKIPMKTRNPPPSESKRGTSTHIVASPSARRRRRRSRSSSLRTRIPPSSIAGTLREAQAEAGSFAEPQHVGPVGGRPGPRVPASAAWSPAFISSSVAADSPGSGAQRKAAAKG
jgi:hypothetical protein